jgi:hypothetical protein
LIKKKLNQIFTFIEENKWDEAKTIWILDFLKQLPEQKTFCTFNQSFNVFGRFLSVQQKYTEDLTCRGCEYNIGVKVSDFLMFSKAYNSNFLTRDIFFIECRKCKNNIISEHGNFVTKPAFLYCEILYKSMTDSVKCYELPEFIYIKDLTFKLILAQIYEHNHFLGIFLLKDKFVVLNDLQNKIRNLEVPPVHKVTHCLYFLV